MEVVRELKYIGIDFWNRPQFKDQDGNYFGNVDVLYDHGASFEDVTEGTDKEPALTEDNIQYFGRESDCDPMGTKIKASAIKLVKEFTEIKTEYND